MVNAAAGQITNATSSLAGVNLGGGGSVDNYGQIANGVTGGNSGNTITLRAGSHHRRDNAGIGRRPRSASIPARGTSSAGATTTYTDAVTGAPSSLTLQNAGTLAAASFGTIALGDGTNTLALRGAGDGTAANGAAGALNLANVTGATVLAKSDAGTWALSGSGRRFRRDHHQRRFGRGAGLGRASHLRDDQPDGEHPMSTAPRSRR